jgi:hypothetical protein
MYQRMLKGTEILMMRAWKKSGGQVSVPSLHGKALSYLGITSPSWISHRLLSLWQVQQPAAWSRIHQNVMPLQSYTMTKNLQ